jgi:hypothetical protein
MERQVLSGSELEEALRSGRLNEPSYEIEAMVRWLEKPHVLQIAVPGRCDTWVELPLELTDHAERIGVGTCPDGIHPVFKITFREPSDPVSKKLLAGLLTALASVPR